MPKFKKCLFLLAFLFCVSYCQHIYALNSVSPINSEVTTGQEDGTWIAIKANVPQNFQRNITINFYSKDGYNAMFVLTNNNNYQLSSLIESGEYTLDFISVYDDIKGTYTYDGAENISIKKGQSNFYEFALFEEEPKTVTVDIVPNQAKENNKEVWIGIGGAVIFLFQAIKKWKE